MTFKVYLGAQNINQKARRNFPGAHSGDQRDNSVWWALWSSDFFSLARAGGRVLDFLGFQSSQLHRNGSRLGIFESIRGGENFSALQ